MNNTGKRIILAAMAIMLASGVALAGETKRKKKGFFESLFGISKKKTSENRKKRRSVFGKNWWDDEDDVRIIDEKNRRKRKRAEQYANDGDPEGDPGLGMGNLPYIPEKTVSLGGMKFTQQRPEKPETAAVYDALVSSSSTLRVLPDQQEAISAHYGQTNFRPLWTEGGQISSRGAAVLKSLAEADAEGLEKQNYLPPSLSSFDARVPITDPAALGVLDIELTAMALRYASHASGGQFDPGRLSRYHDVKPERAPASQALKVLAWSPYPAEYLKSLNPTHAAYAAMKVALADLRNKTASPDFEPIAAGGVIRPGQADFRIEAIRQRLSQRGFSAALEDADDPLVLDADLSEQIRLFQKASGIAADGLIGKQTIRALNTDMGERNLARLLDNMERLRWLPKDLGRRHVFVNQAAFEVKVVDDGAEIWRSRVIVGKPINQTNVFHDEIETVVFNPSWGVPPSIIANEYLPKLRRDPGYLDRIGFKVVNTRGKVVSSRSVDWDSYGNKVPYGIQQPPGQKNALGELKFLFPNRHNIYMHDTPSRNLFEKDFRAFSHGCVRVQNPREFAEVLLGWDREEIDQKTDSKKSRTVKLDTKVPVHITYFTAWPDETGNIQYFSDVYNRDKTMENARSAITLAQR